MPEETTSTRVIVKRVKRTREDYIKDLSGDVGFFMHNYLTGFPETKADKLEYLFKIGFSGDNRKRHTEMWGKCDFTYKGEFYYRIWSFEVTIDNETAIFYVATAKDKGTCYERVGHSWREPPKKLNPFDKAFADWLRIEYEKHPLEGE